MIFDYFRMPTTWWNDPALPRIRQEIKDRLEKGFSNFYKYRWSPMLKPVFCKNIDNGREVAAFPQFRYRDYKQNPRETTALAASRSLVAIINKEEQIVFESFNKDPGHLCDDLEFMCKVFLDNGARMVNVFVNHKTLNSNKIFRKWNSDRRNELVFPCFCGKIEDDVALVIADPENTGVLYYNSIKCVEADTAKRIGFIIYEDIKIETNKHFVAKVELK